MIDNRLNLVYYAVICVLPLWEVSRGPYGCWPSIGALDQAAISNCEERLLMAYSMSCHSRDWSRFTGSW